VRSETEEGRRQFTLTDEGRAELAKNPRASAPWEAMVRGADQGDLSLRTAVRHVMIAVRQVAEAEVRTKRFARRSSSLNCADSCICCWPNQRMFR